MFSLLLLFFLLPVGMICSVTRYESRPQEVALKLKRWFGLRARNVLFQVKRAFEHRQTRIIEEIKRATLGTDKSLSLFLSLTWPTCLNWRSDLSLHTMDAGVHSLIRSCSWRCLQTFRVTQAQGMCISIPSQTSHVRPLVTGELESI